MQEWSAVKGWLSVGLLFIWGGVIGAVAAAVPIHTRVNESTQATIELIQDVCEKALAQSRSAYLVDLSWSRSTFN